MLEQVGLLKQKCRLAPLQIAQLNLFHCDQLEIEQKIVQELNNNPFLEKSSDCGEEELLPDAEPEKEAYDFRDSNEYEDNDLPDYRYDHGNYSFSGQIRSAPVAEEWDFRKDIKQQLGCLAVTQKERMVGEYLIDCCNEKGFLEDDRETLADGFSLEEKCWTTAEEINSVLDKIRILEPQGVGSRNVREFYIFQLRSRKKPEAAHALQLLEMHYADLLERKWDKIKRSMSLSAEAMQTLLQYIASLKTTPVPECKQNYNNIIPDFILETEDEEIRIRLNRSHSSFLRINTFWKEKVKAVTMDRHANKPTKEYMKQKLSSAQWFIDAIQQREHNLLKTMEAIAGFQKEYFLTGETMNIRPMILKNIADITKLDISTVSRLTSNKYVAAPFGNLCLKKLFSEGIATVSGDAASTRVFEAALAGIIGTEAAEDPYTDQQITELLLKQGFCLARRTVSKYRERLKIPRWGIRKRKIQ